MGPLATKTRTLVALLVVLGALAASVAACGDADDDADAAAAAPREQAWKKVVPGGDCQCTDGSQFSFWKRKANPKKVLLYLQDGGACYSAKTCAPERDLYKRR